MPLNCTLHNGLDGQVLSSVYFNTIEKNPSSGGKNLLALHILLRFLQGPIKLDSIWIRFDCSEVTSSLRTQFRV